MPESSLDLSVLFSTWNRADRLEETLNLFTELDTDGLEWEIIAIANNCTDNTKEILERASDHLPMVVLEEPRAGKNVALNKGLEVTRGKLILFCDDDIVPEKDWLKQILSVAERWPDDSIFGGRIDPLFPDHTPAWIADPSFHFAIIAFARYVVADEEGPVPNAPHGPNMAIRASAMEGMRYEEGLGPKGRSFPMGDETELLRRLHKKGHRYIYAAKARVGHPVEHVQLTLKWLCGRAQRFGRGYARLSTERDVPYLLGIPRFLWRELLRNWSRHVFNFGDAEARFKTGYPFAVTLGQISEYRVMAEEARSDV